MALINCEECGRQISDMATACPGCGAPVTKSNDSPDNSAHTEQLISELRTHTHFFRSAVSPEEILIGPESGCQITFAINVTLGEITLTEHRIVFCKGNMGKLFLMGASAVLFDNGPKITFHIFHRDIDYIDVARHGFAKKLKIKLKAGETHTVQVQETKKWISALKALGIRVNE